METGAITSYIDVAQVALYVFWLFFFTLIFYLHRESKREGYPLETTTGRKKVGFPTMPGPKEFRMPHGGGTRVVPRPEPEPEPYPLAAVPVSRSPGSPLHPSGDPMADGVGPAAYNKRPEVPDLTVDGEPRIVPLRVATDHGLDRRDPDPRGKPVTGCDGVVGGHVVDVWVDRSEPFVRYLELEVGERRVLLPMVMARVRGSDGHVMVKSIRGDQFAGVPGLANPDQVTLQEEDKITAYYGGGHLYATPDRLEPLL
jgi:photosynthetic reaction center H subunit